MNERTAAADKTAAMRESAAQFLQQGKERSEAIFNVQKELLDEYEEASRVWIARLRSEVALWSELAGKVTSSRSIPEGLEAYRDGVAQRLQMAADDGPRLLEEGQKVIAMMTKAVANGLSKKSE